MTNERATATTREERESGFASPAVSKSPVRDIVAHVRSSVAVDGSQVFTERLASVERRRRSRR